MPSYVIISPVRNEEAHLPRTIASVVGQTLRPERWVIVDDGSSDGTPRILEQAAKEHDWIRVVQRPDRGFRKTGGGVIETFNQGLRWVEDLGWDYVVKLDCDLSFEVDYFARLLQAFEQEPRLGIGSGVYWEERPLTGWRETRMPAYHAAGACKVVRRACFEEIGGFIAERGWDTVDEIRAMARDWRTTHFRELRMKHWKPEGSGIGQWRTSLMLGEIYYLTGGGKLFFVLKVIRRLVGWPFLVGGLGMALGYTRMLWNGRSPLVSAAEAECYRSLLRERLVAGMRRILQLS